MNHLKAAQEFGRQLILTQDLDPVYCSVVNANLDWNQRARLVLAYSCLYHLGVSAYLSEFKGAKFWEKLRIAAINKNHDWPRGTERRHWRGENAIASVNWLHDRFPNAPEHVFKWCTLIPQFTFVMARVQEIPSFGPWAAFKCCDLLERVLGTPIDLTGCDLAFYESPRAGAALLNLSVSGAIAKLQKALGHLTAPPGGRKVGVMEIETVLCKFHSMVNGHYY